MSTIKVAIPSASVIRTLVETYYRFQDQRIEISNRIKANQRLNKISDEQVEAFNLDKLLKNAKSFEDDIKKQIEKEIKKYPIYSKHLKNVKGMGATLSGGLIAYIEDAGRFKNISKLWQYCGVGMNSFCKKCDQPTYIKIEYKSQNGKNTKAKKLAPMKNCPDCGGETVFIPQKRTRGYQTNWNGNLKTLLWKIATSFVKQKAGSSGYRRIYNDIKLRLRKEHPNEVKMGNKKLYTKGHINNMTLKILEKIFLAHLWIRWREIEGLQVTEPYVETILGHSTIKPFVDIDENS